MQISELKSKHPEHWNKAAAIRVLAMDAVQAANSGHPGMPMGMADVATVLFEKHLKFDASAPQWPDRDRFVLSAGHGSMLLYGLLHLTGYSDMTIEQIRNFRQIGSITAGHPEYGHAGGIETTTGPLGQGLANAVGMAMAEASMGARFSKKLVDHHTYVVAGDGCLMEGVSHEAIGLAGRLKLGKLIVLWDDNGISIDGKLELSDNTDQLKRFQASEWSTFSCNGHDPEEIDAAITAAKKSGKPSLIACKTNIGYGSPNKQGTSKAHGSPLGDDEIALVREIYGWSEAPFIIPSEIKSSWEVVGARGAGERMAWEGRLAAVSSSKQSEFSRVISGEPHKKLSAAVKRFKAQVSEEAPKVATRKSSEMALEVINSCLPETIGGSADLTGSNNTLTKGLGTFDESDREGRYVYYGIREHGMAAAMNGMALHGGVKPYGGTFMCFTDYARPSMRLAALMGLPVSFVMTHDSIGLGEDGPTHQPVEHLAISRSTPNTLVFRPADTIETVEAWELAMSSKASPSVLSLTRQGLPTVRTKHTGKNLTAQGAYVLVDAEVAKRQVILMATGSEVEIALAAREALESEGIGTRVVSMPCWELFEQQDPAYRRKVLPPGPVRVGVEAAVRMGWDKWLFGENGKRDKGDFVGMESFGASGPGAALYEHFGITPENVVAKAKAML